MASQSKAELCPKKNQEQFHLATTLDKDDLDVCWFVGVDAASHKTVIVNSHNHSHSQQS